MFVLIPPEPPPTISLRSPPNDNITPARTWVIRVASSIHERRPVELVTHSLEEDNISPCLVFGDAMLDHRHRDLGRLESAGRIVGNHGWTVLVQAPPMGDSRVKSETVEQPGDGSKVPQPAPRPKPRISMVDGKALAFQASSAHAVTTLPRGRTPVEADHFVYGLGKCGHQTARTDGNVPE